jgi:hypothetical protein
MKRIMVIASFLIASLGLTIQIHAVPQPGDPQVKQRVSKTAKKVAAQAKVSYQGPPQFAPITGTAITYATNSSEPVLNLGDAFYVLYPFYNPIVLNRQNVWLVSESAQGPWAPAYYVPAKAITIACSKVMSDPSRPYQLCALPRPS